MPGFMGIRGLELKNPHETERQRRDDRKVSKGELERRADEKAQEILRGQEGDMSAHTGEIHADSGNSHYRIAGYMVGEIMSAKVAVLDFDDNLLTVEGIFSRVKFRHLPVVEADGNLIGILSDRDFLRTISPFFGTINEQTRDKEIMMRKVGTIMTRNPICANIDTTILQAVRLMNSHKISCLPIVEMGGMRLLGIVTWKDVVRAFCPKAFDHVRDSARLKTGIRINPQSTESARLRAVTAESEGRALRHLPGNEEESGEIAAQTSEALLDEQRDATGAPDMPPAPDAADVPVAGQDDAPADVPPAVPDDAEEDSEGTEMLTVAPPHSEGLERKKQRGISDTDLFLPSPDTEMMIAASEKLPDRRTAGQAGSELAARQRALLREQLERTTDSSRLRALRDEQHPRKE